MWICKRSRRKFYVDILQEITTKLEAGNQLQFKWIRSSLVKKIQDCNPFSRIFSIFFQTGNGNSGSSSNSNNPGQTTQVSPMMSSWTSNTSSTPVSPWGEPQAAAQQQVRIGFCLFIYIRFRENVKISWNWLTFYIFSSPAAVGNSTVSHGPSC